MIRTRLLRGAGALLGALLIGAATQAATPAATSDRGPQWATLSAAQQQTLAPLQRDWPTIERNQRQKWLEVAAKFPSMPADERQRVQERMAEWARLTPSERTRARLQFQEVLRLPADERQAKWQAYQALSETERLKLAQRAKPVAKAASAPEAATKARPTADNGKHNLVTGSVGVPSRPVAPIVVQAKPGATTTTMSTRQPPPPHSQPGLPKIAATPGYVDSTTLLPRRGPQGAATTADAAEHP